MKVYNRERAGVRQPTDFVFAAGSRSWVRPVWTRACMLGSGVAMTVSAAVSLLVSTYLAQYRSGMPRDIAIELIAMAAILEGALIGYFQWRVLRRLFPTMSSMHWVGATMIAAGFGCLIAWLPTSFALTASLAGRIGDNTPGPATILRVSLVTGALIGLVWGAAQYLVLRLHAARAASWILASVISWTVSFVWIYLAAFSPDRTTSPLIHIALGTLSGLICGTALGLVQGRVLVGLKSRLLHP